MNRHTQEVADQNNARRRGHENGSQRSSRRRSDVRHGRIYEASPETTIRAVTPDSADSMNADITALPSPTSFQPVNQMRFQSQDPSASVSNTDEEGTIENRRRKSKKKSNHRDVGQQDTSPNSFFEKTRKRLNSITTTSSSSPRQDENAVSIGFPSVVQASVFPDLQEMRQQLPRTPRRTYSSDTTATTINTPAMRSPLILESDVNKILQLMKTTCGRMHGILFYRPIGTTAWNSGYCAINVAPGSLICQTKGDLNNIDVLIPDLRGCTVRTQYDSQSRSTHLSVVLPISGLGYQLRPPIPETFESWLAALLCWQPLRPKGVHNKMTKPQSVVMHDRHAMGNRRLSDIANQRSTTIVKTGQMHLWDGLLPAGSVRHHSKKRKLSVQDQDLSWKRVNCTLHENGTLRLLSEENAAVIRSIKLSDLARCAIQRLDESVLDAPHCVAIHPQYLTTGAKPTEMNPLVLSLESRTVYEAWFVLLRAMAVPELYGPETGTPRPESKDRDLSTTSLNMFRIERVLRVKIVEAKFNATRNKDLHLPYEMRSFHNPGEGTEVYADIMLGRDLRARTATKQFKNSIFWADEFCLEDVPSVSSKVSIILKLSNPDEKEWTMVPKGGYDLPVVDHTIDLEPIEVAANDPLYGRVNILLSDLEQDKVVEKWWQLVDANGINVGQALIKLSLEENVVLLEAEYAELSTLLHNFDNSLTSQLGQLLSSELRRLSDVLLDVFQCSGKAEDWINNLVEEEIDGIYREEPPIRTRFSGRVRSNDSRETGEKRELFVRDLSRSATTEANLLFRGNSLVTKALEAHMRRIGREYLERTLGEKIRSIVSEDPDCEVDPVKVRSSEQLERNWSRLIGLTSSIWQAISTSVSRCPPGMRNILKHVRSCAEDRYGNFIRTVKYTSVSGFLFLRFFCPAILNPKLFGLLEDHPPERARRSFTLIAKSLIVLANMSKFGQKEPWMEPMNRFLTTATTDFKNFIEEFCSWNMDLGSRHEPQYQAAVQVKQRLSPLSREGLPSLPFLLDAPTAMATLVDLWTNHAPPDIFDDEVDECVKTFHRICLELKQKTHDCMANAEKAQEPNSKLERQWQKMLSEQHRTRITVNPFEDMVGTSEITALPQAPEVQENYSRRHQFRPGFGIQDNSPTLGEKRDAENQHTSGQMAKVSSASLTNVPSDVHDEYRMRQRARSREGSGRGRLLSGRIENASSQDFPGRV